MAVESGKVAAAKPILLRLHVLRGAQVILDRDLAALYGIRTSRLNIAVERHIERFPSDFAFQLSTEEWHSIKERGRHGGIRYCPRAFTEQGVMMVASILRGPRAVAVSLEVMRTFARERDAGVLPKLDLDAIHVQKSTKSILTYFIQAGDTGLIKIGVTTDFEKRLRSLETMSPVPLRILGVVRGDIEAECHTALAKWRQHGEWFEPTSEVFDFLRKRIAIKPSVN